MPSNSPKFIYLAALAIIIITTTLLIGNNNKNMQTTSLSSTTISPTNLTQSSNTIKHVIIVVIENREYSNIISSLNAPYENSLASKYVLATNYFAISHPSEPNYIAMIAGSTLNITNDGNVSQNQKSATNLVDLFKTKNVSWKAYEESMPTPCDTNDSSDGLYVTKHNPFVYMIDITNNLTYCENHVVKLTQFYNDLTNNQLPQYAFITPNMNDDGHSTSIAFADNWLSTFIPTIINSSSFESSIIFLTYDEGTTNLGGGGHIATIIIGPNSILKQSFKTQIAYSHYSLLTTIESIYRIGNLSREDANAAIMSDIFVTAK